MNCARWKPSGTARAADKPGKKGGSSTHAELDLADKLAMRIASMEEDDRIATLLITEQYIGLKSKTESF